MPPVKKTRPSRLLNTKDSLADNGSQEQTVISGQLNKKIEKEQERLDRKRGVVFIKHLPHGFFEEQIKKYFEQFGNVTRLRLARSRSTGNSKGFAFVEFEYPEVAQVAAETMHNYLMFRKLVKAFYIPPEKQKFNYFKSTVRKVKNKAGKFIYVSSKTRAIDRKMKQHNSWTDENYQKRTERGMKKLKNFEKKYGHLGIDFSKIVVKPIKKMLKENGEQANDEENAVGSLKLKVDEKIKTPTEIVAEAQAKQKSTKELKKELEPADLLGNTIIEDSDDDDFIPMMASDDEEDAEISSDEETYMLSDEDLAKPKMKIVAAKPPKIDRLEQFIKRKAHTGGIQKIQKKKLPAAKAVNLKSSVKVDAIIELAKPLKTMKRRSLPKPTTVNKKKNRK